MNLKRPAAVTAAILAAAAAAVSVSAEDVGKAGIYLADSDWLVQYWGGDIAADGNSGIASVDFPTINGDGEYSAYIEFEYEVTGLSFIALCTDISAESCPADMNVYITSVKVNGEAADFGINGTPKFKEDGGFMRVNVYNCWSDDKADEAVEPSVFEGAKSVKVNFTVDGLESDETVTTVTESEVTEKVSEETSLTEITESETAVSEEPSDKSPSEEESGENSASTGNSAAAALISATAAAAAAVVISRGKGK